MEEQKYFLVNFSLPRTDLVLLDDGEAEGVELLQGQIQLVQLATHYTQPSLPSVLYNKAIPTTPNHPHHQYYTV